MRNRARRAVGISSLCLLLIGIGLLLIPASGAEAAIVAPVLVGGNASCGSLDSTWVEFHKVEPVTDQGVWPAPDADMHVTWDAYSTTSGQAFDWTSSFPVLGVFVKGGPDGYLYRYPSGSMSDTLLHAPSNASGQWAGLSHVSFCYNPVADTTTIPPTSSTLLEPTTSTTLPGPTSTTTLLQPTTTSTLSESTTTSSSTSSLPPQLGAIGDYVWIDANENGEQDEWEVPVEGFDVWLFDWESHLLVGADKTGADGRYWIGDLEAGSYYLVFSGLEEDDYFTTRNADDVDDSMDSDVDKSGYTGRIDLAAGQIDDTWDAGLLRVRVLPQVITTSTIPETLPVTGNATTPSLAGLALALLAFGGMTILSLRRREDKPIVGWSARLPDVL